MRLITAQACNPAGYYVWVDTFHKKQLGLCCVLHHSAFVKGQNQHLKKNVISSTFPQLGYDVKESIPVKCHLQLVLRRWPRKLGSFLLVHFRSCSQCLHRTPHPFFFWSSRILVNSRYFVLLKSLGTEYWPKDQSKAFEWVTNSPFSSHQLFSETEIETWVIKES